MAENDNIHILVDADSCPDDFIAENSGLKSIVITSDILLLASN